MEEVKEKRPPHSGRPPLPPEERERRKRERADARNKRRREERARNNTKRFRDTNGKKGKVPIKATKFQLVRHGKSGKNSLDVEKDTWLIMREVAKGKSYVDIAAWLTELNGYTVLPRDVYTYTRKALVEWKKDNLKNADAFIAFELGKLEELESIVLADYEKSRVPKPSEYAALMKQGLTMEEIDAWYEAKGGYTGDAIYLDKLLMIQQRRLKMLGIDSGNDVAQTTIVNYGFDMKDFGEFQEIVGKMQDRKHDALYEEANIVEEE